MDRQVEKLENALFRSALYRVAEAESAALLTSAGEYRAYAPSRKDVRHFDALACRLFGWDGAEKGNEYEK